MLVVIEDCSFLINLLVCSSSKSSIRKLDFLDDLAPWRGRYSIT